LCTVGRICNRCTGRSYDNIAPSAKCQRVLVLALCLVVNRSPIVDGGAAEIIKSGSHKRDTVNTMSGRRHCCQQRRPTLSSRPMCLCGPHIGSLVTRCNVSVRPSICPVKAKFRYARRKLVRSWFEAGSKLVRAEIWHII